MAISAAIFGNIGGYWLGKRETEKKYFTPENKCTVLLDNGGASDGYCIEVQKPTPCPTPAKNL